MVERSLYPRMAAALFALVGLINATYLTLTRLQISVSLVCPAGGGCEQVQNSVWSTFPPGSGIPLSVIGMVGCIVLLALSLTSLHSDYIAGVPIPPVILLVASFGAGFSLYLVGVQVMLIQAICFWCMVSAFLEISIWIAVLWDWRTWRNHSSNIHHTVLHGHHTP